MPIIPSGMQKIMQAQYNVKPENRFGDNFSVTETAQEQPIPEVSPSEDEAIKIPDQEDKQRKPDLLEYIYAVLEKLGYPPRRLDAFSDEFIEEQMYPGGMKEVKVILPDRYYGKKKRLSDKDLNKIMDQIQSNFGLVLTEAVRKEKKVIMDFTSAQSQEQGEVKAEQPEDDLDVIFGKPKNEKSSETKAMKGGNKKKAQTIQEMIKENRNTVIDSLMKMLEK